MNSNHPMLYFRYEEETKWSVTQEIQSHKERSTDCNINDTGISEKNLMHSLCYSKIDMFSKIIPQHDGFQPPSHKKDVNIYKNNRSSKKISQLTDRLNLESCN